MAEPDLSDEAAKALGKILTEKTQRRTYTIRKYELDHFMVHDVDEALSREGLPPGQQ